MSAEYTKAGRVHTDGQDRAGHENTVRTKSCKLSYHTMWNEVCDEIRHVSEACMSAQVLRMFSYMYTNKEF